MDDTRGSLTVKVMLKDGRVVEATQYADGKIIAEGKPLSPDQIQEVYEPLYG
jgi:putative N-acetylmannosamine-6-phosphate epimerase